MSANLDEDGEPLTLLKMWYRSQALPEEFVSYCFAPPDPDIQKWFETHLNFFYEAAE